MNIYKFIRVALSTGIVGSGLFTAIVFFTSGQGFSSPLVLASINIGSILIILELMLKVRALEKKLEIEG